MEGIKSKKSLAASLIMIFLFLALIGLCLYRMLSRNFDLLFIIYTGIGLIVLFYLIKEIIFFFKYLILPKTLLKLDNEKITIFGKNTEEILLTDIIKVNFKDNQKFFLVANPTLVINTKSKVYHVGPLKDVDKIVSQINSLIKETSN